MKTKILMALLCLFPLFVAAQNYEQQGDELFAQAQYEKAEKKYKAAIEILGASSSLQSKKEKCAQCAKLLKQAISAEESSNYATASNAYADLYAIHALPNYKSKADALQRKADTIREQQRAAEQAERERQAQLEAERKARLEAERQAEQERQAKRKYDQERQARLDAEREIQQSATLILEQTEYDFGRINETNGRVSVVFKFKNTGQNPLVISNVRTSCGCVSAIWSKEPILQGKVGSITVTFNPVGRPGRFQKTITITSNAPEGTHRVCIKGEVIPK